MKRALTTLLLLIFSGLCAQNLDPLRTEDYDAQEQWVDRIIKNMTVDEKIGQLFMIQAYSNKDTAHTNFIKRMISDYHVGNLLFMQGTPQRQAALHNTYQSLAKVPLMIGFDGEWGLDMRLKNTYRFPWNMTLGAIQDNRLIFQLGQHLGKHCKRLGIHVNFAPVVDINTNSKNPIIGSRSFGEDKKNVTQKSIAFIQGLQNEGVFGVAKHFPGHGDTATDSHLALPVLNFNMKRLKDIELYPYKNVFDAGVGGVMTAHLSVPVLEANSKLPTSLSYSVVSGLLKEKLGFLGLIFTDGLNMKGAANYATPAQINLAALQAGNDILLIPQDIPETVKLIKKSLEQGNLSVHKIDGSVKKILLAKYKLGLHQYQAVDTLNLVADLNTSSDDVLHRILVKASMTVIKNKKEILPIKDLKKYQKIAYVELGEDTGNDFLNTLKKYTEVVKVSGTQLKKMKKILKNFDLIIAGYHTSNKNPWKPFKFSDKELVWLDEIGKSNEVILSVFASPYSLLDVTSFANIEGILIGYQNSKIAQEKSAQLIFGAIAAKGVLPVSSGDRFKIGDGISTKAINLAVGRFKAWALILTLIATGILVTA